MIYAPFSDSQIERLKKYFMNKESCPTCLENISVKLLGQDLELCMNCGSEFKYLSNGNYIVYEQVSYVFKKIEEKRLHK